MSNLVEGIEEQLCDETLPIAARISMPGGLFAGSGPYGLAVGTDADGSDPPLPVDGVGVMIWRSQSIAKGTTVIQGYSIAVGSAIGSGGPSVVSSVTNAIAYPPALATHDGAAW